MEKIYAKDGRAKNKIKNEKIAPIAADREKMQL